MVEDRVVLHLRLFGQWLGMPLGTFLTSQARPILVKLFQGGDIIAVELLRDLPSGHQGSEHLSHFPLHSFNFK